MTADHSLAFVSAQRALDTVADLWDDVVESRLARSGGRDRPDLSSTRLELIERDGWRLRDEIVAHAKATRTTPIRLTPTASPIDLDLVEVIVTVADRILRSEQHVRKHLGRGPSGLTGDRESHVVAGCRWLRAHLHELDADWVEFVATQARAAARSCRQVLGEPDRVYQLDVPCPVCDLLTLQVNYDREPRTITCTNQACRCDRPAHACSDGARHTWSEPQWERAGIRLSEAMRGVLAS